jgi:hypothetical protein
MKGGIAMKKCSKCGLVQDDRHQCIDCGAVLGESMPEADEERYLEELSDKVDGMSDSCEEFYVSPKQRWFGIGAAAAALLALVIFVLGASFTPDEGSVAMYAAFGLILGTASALHLLFPEAMWKFETFRYRFHIDGAFSPSDNYLIVMKFFSYVCFGAGALSSVWALVQFLIHIK